MWGKTKSEEINYLPAGTPGGANFGWDFFEGSSVYEGAPPSDLQLIPPVAEYRHDMGCSVTGGVVYRGSRLPAWQGVYLFRRLLQRDGVGTDAGCSRQLAVSNAVRAYRPDHVVRPG